MNKTYDQTAATKDAEALIKEVDNLLNAYKKAFPDLARLADMVDLECTNPNRNPLFAHSHVWAKQMLVFAGWMMATGNLPAEHLLERGSFDPNSAYRIRVDDYLSPAHGVAPMCKHPDGVAELLAQRFANSADCIRSDGCQLCVCTAREAALSMALDVAEGIIESCVDKLPV